MSAARAAAPPDVVDKLLGALTRMAYWRRMVNGATHCGPDHCAAMRAKFLDAANDFRALAQGADHEVLTSTVPADILAQLVQP